MREFGIHPDREIVEKIEKYDPSGQTTMNKVILSYNLKDGQARLS